MSGVFEFTKNWNADGFISTIVYLKDLEKILSLNIPVIVPKYQYPKEPFRSIRSDSHQVGEMAAEYYMEKGFKFYAFCGYKNRKSSQERCDAYCETLQAKGFTASVYKQNYTQPHYAQPLRYKKNEMAHIVDWLKGLDRPVAVFAANDLCGRDVLEACQLAGLEVPNEVAVLGVNNEEIECNFLAPPLSSITFNTERTGYEAAELFEKILSGQPIDSNEIIMQAKYVVERQSTDVLQIADKDIASALRHIRKHSNKILQVSDVLKSTAVSKRSLELKFAQILGRTIREDIRKCHAKYIAQLLIETDMPVYKIAMYLGYTTDHNISRFFQKAMGYTPQEYRKKFGRK